MKTNYLKKYIISSYILVWILIIFVAGAASLVFHYVDRAKPYCMVTDLPAFAWMETFQT